MQRVMNLNKGGLARDDFMTRLEAAARKEGKRIGVDHRIIMAQAIQETGWGKHVKGNNYFGIKAHGSDDGKNVEFTTHEVVDGKKVKIKDTFKGYDSLEDSVKGYADFLLENPRYKPMLEADGYEEQLVELGKSGYATDPDYTKKLSGIITGKTFNNYYNTDEEVTAPVPDMPADNGYMDQASINAAVEQAAQTPGVVADNEGYIDMSPMAEAAEQMLMPQPQMEVPNLMQPMQAPDYVPSVTDRKKQQPGHFNIGGFIKSFFEDDEEDREKKLKEVERLRKIYREMNAIEEGAEYDPRGANQVPTPDWQMSPEGQSVKNLQDARSGNLPTIPQIPVEPEVGGFNQRAPELNNRIQMIHNIPQMPAPPTIESAPPTPPAPMVPPSVTPDAVVNEQLSAKQQWK